MIRRSVLVLSLFALVAAACGHSLIAQTAAQNPVANRQALKQEAKQEAKKIKGTLSKGGITPRSCAIRQLRGRLPRPLRACQPRAWS